MSATTPRPPVPTVRAHEALEASLPSRDRWVIGLVVVAIASLIAGFAAYAPALRIGDRTRVGLVAGVGTAPTTTQAEGPASEDDGPSDGSMMDIGGAPVLGASRETTVDSER